VVGILSGSAVDINGNFIGSAVVYTPLLLNAKATDLPNKSEALQLVDSLVYDTVFDTKKMTAAFEK
jgi:hypothetical protein